MHEANAKSENVLLFFQIEGQLKLEQIIVKIDEENGCGVGRRGRAHGII